jgi:hypothetical protein
LRIAVESGAGGGLISIVAGRDWLCGAGVQAMADTHKATAIASADPALTET